MTTGTRRLSLTLAAVLWLPFAAPADAARFAQICVFGDSLSDTGNVFVVTGDLSRRPFDLIPSAPYPRGGISFSNGRLWIQHLAREYQRSRDARPAQRRPGRFCNYAFGGARARQIDPARFDLPAQVATYLNDFGAAPAGETLFVVFLGGNDIRDALEAFATDPTGATSAAIIEDAIRSISNNVLALYNLAGGRQFLVFNAPNVGLVPAVRLAGPAAQAGASLLSNAFAAGMASALDMLELLPGIDIWRVDLLGLTNAIAANPPPGITNTTDPCITPGVVRGAICDDPDAFAFWDGIHPTRVIHRLIFETADRALAPPVPLAMNP